MLGRTVFQAHPCVLFRMPAWQDASIHEEAARIIPLLYRSFVDGSVQEDTASMPFPNFTRQRLLRAVCGFAVWKGELDWLYSLALTAGATDPVIFLALSSALLEGRSTLASFFDGRLKQRMPLMDDLLHGIRVPYDEQEPDESAGFLNYFYPGKSRKLGDFRKLGAFREASEAALGWMLLGGHFVKFEKASAFCQAESGSKTNLRQWFAAANGKKSSNVEGDSTWNLDSSPGIKEGNTPVGTRGRMAAESRAGTYFQARLILARQAIASRRWMDADSYLKHTLTWHPYVLHLQAQAHIGLGELGLAAACYRKIVKRHPDRAEFCENYGRILSSMGDEAGSARALGRAAEIRSSAKRVYS